MIIAAAQFTIRDASDPILSGTEPANKVDGMLWLDTSASPNLLKKWNAANNAWEIVNDTSDLEEDLRNEIESQIKTVNASIEANANGIEANVIGLDNAKKEISSIKTEMTPSGIYALVKDSSGYQKEISEVKQQADRIDLIVTSESDSSSVSLTDSAMEFISENVEIDAKRIDLNANESFTSTVGEVDALQTRMTQTEEALTGYVKQDELEVYIRLDADSKGVEIGTNDSDFFTHTKNTGFLIKHREDNDIDKTVGMFNYKGLETNELALGVDPDRTSERKIVVRATTSGGWVWVLD